MREIGLQPSNTGEPGGKETGQSMSHYILPDGRYSKVFAKLAATGFQLHWQSAPAISQGKAKKASKNKYTCPQCGQNAWAGTRAQLICGVCYNGGGGDIRLMLSMQKI
jgi:hypothetical protein